VVLWSGSAERPDAAGLPRCSVAIPLEPHAKGVTNNTAGFSVTNNAEIASGRTTRVRAGPTWMGLLIWTGVDEPGFKCIKHNAGGRRHFELSHNCALSNSTPLRGI
jgi:hypothetical protein